MKKVIALALAAIMPFSNPIIGNNDTLIRDKMQSENYVAGVSGWIVTRDGHAEFNDVTSRGTVIVGPTNAQHIEISTNNPPDNIPKVKWWTGAPGETSPGEIASSGPSSLNELQLAIKSPLHTSAPVGSIRPEIDLTSWSGSQSLINLWADKIYSNVEIDLLSNDFWTAPTLVNSWVDLAGARAGYFKDVTGRVQMRGQVVSGTATTITTLPVGYRPTQSMEWIMRGVGGVVMCAVQVATTGVVSVTANAATAQASGIKLDAISFPTL